LEDVISLWEEGDGKGLYVKDWHLPALLEEEGGDGAVERELYRCPDVFADDWLNGWYRSREGRSVEDDFRFLVSGSLQVFKLAVKPFADSFYRPTSSLLLSIWGLPLLQPSSTGTSTPPTHGPRTSPVASSGGSSLPRTAIFSAASQTSLGVS
jgi:hypothetical protein